MGFFVGTVTLLFRSLPECTEESQDKIKYVIGYREIYLD
jgi:hypothetical protein